MSMISVAVAGAGGRMGSQMVKSIMANPAMELVAGFDPAGIGTQLAPGLEISSPTELDEVLKEVKPCLLYTSPSPRD